MKKWLSYICFFVLLTFTNLSLGIDLLGVYQIALSRDPVYQAAKHRYLAIRQERPIAVSAMLPQISALGTLEYQGINVNNQTDELFDQLFNFNATQTIFNLAQWFNLSRANAEIKQEAATLQATALNLIIRCTQSYIKILAAYDDLRFAQAEKESFAQQYTQSKQRFDVGLTEITSVQEAKAKFDSKSAEVIAKENELANAKEEIRLLIGFVPDSFARLRKDFVLLSPTPTDINRWVCQAKSQNYQIIAARYAALVKRREVSIARSGHLPTVTGNFDYAGLNASNNAPLLGVEKGLTTTWTANATMNINIFQGGLVLATTARQRNLYCVSLDDLEKITRDTVSNTRQDYRNVMTSITEVKALEQSVTSSRAALKSTRAGFDVGTRTSVNVVERISDLYNQKRQLAYAKYLYLLNYFLLKQDAGILAAEDVVAINHWLAYSDLNDSDIKNVKDVKPKPKNS